MCRLLPPMLVSYCGSTHSIGAKIDYPLWFFEICGEVNPVVLDLAVWTCEGTGAIRAAQKRGADLKTIVNDTERYCNIEDVSQLQPFGGSVGHKQKWMHLRENQTQGATCPSSFRSRRMLSRAFLSRATESNGRAGPVGSLCAAASIFLQEQKCYKAVTKVSQGIFSSENTYALLSWELVEKKKKHTHTHYNYRFLIFTQVKN